MGLAAERPVTGVVLDTELVPEDVGLKAAVEEFTVRFPSLWLVLVARSGTDPWGLFRLGRAGLGNLVLTHLDELHAGVARAIRTGFGLSTEALVTRAVSAHLPASETLAVRLALRAVDDGEPKTTWSVVVSAPSDPLPSDPDWAGEVVYTDVRSVYLGSGPEVIRPRLRAAS